MQNLIKNNKLINISFFYLGSFIMKFFGMFIKTNKRRILFSSGMGKGIFDSPLVIYNSMKTDPFFNDYEMIWAVDNVERYVDKYNVVKIDTIKYFYYALSSKIWITSVNIERGLKFKKKGTIYLNTWHGVPLKYIGLDVKSRNDYDFSHVDYFLSSGNYETKIYAKSFNLPPNNIKATGNPRNISLYNSIELSTEERRKKMGELGLQDYFDKKVILFAPTWKDYKYDKLDLNLIVNSISSDYVLLIKSHPLEKLDFKEESVIDMSSVSDIAILLPIVDILISDYSSVMIDFSIFSKPIVSYAPDFDYYEATRGLYVDKQDLAPNVFDSVEEVVNYINNINNDIEKEKTSSYESEFLEVDPRVGLPQIIKFLKDDIERGR